MVFLIKKLLMEYLVLRMKFEGNWLESKEQEPMPLPMTLSFGFGDIALGRQISEEKGLLLNFKKGKIREVLIKKGKEKL